MCKQPAKKPVHPLLSSSLWISRRPTAAAAGPPVLAAFLKDDAKAAGVTTGWIRIRARAEIIKSDLLT